MGRPLNIIMFYCFGCGLSNLLLKILYRSMYVYTSSDKEFQKLTIRKPKTLSLLCICREDTCKFILHLLLTFGIPGTASPSSSVCLHMASFSVLVSFLLPYVEHFPVTQYLFFRNGCHKTLPYSRRGQTNEVHNCFIKGISTYVKDFLIQPV